MFSPNSEKNGRDLDLGYLLSSPERVEFRHLYTKQSHVPLLEVLQQIRERMEAIAKGIVSDHWSTVI